MNDQDIAKLAAKLTRSLATKDDLRNFATKDDLKQLSTKDDLKKVELRLTKVEHNLMNEIKSVGQALSDFTDAIDEKVEDHEKRLQKIETITLITHDIA